MTGTKESKRERAKIFWLVLLGIVVIISAVFSILRIVSISGVILLYDDSSDMLRAFEEAYEAYNLDLKVFKIRYNPDTVKKQLEVVSRHGIRLIIGPRLSSEAEVLLPILVELDMYAISPTVTSPRVVGIDRRIVTMAVEDKKQIEMLVQEMMKDEIKRLLVIKGEENDAYALPFIELLKLEFEGEEVIVHCLHKDAKKEFELPDNVLNFDGILCVTDGKTTGMLCKKLFDIGYKGKIYASDYAMDKNLLLFSKKYIDKLKVFMPVSKKIAPSKNADYVGTYNAVILAKLLLERYHNDLKRAFTELINFSFEGIDGPVTITENYYATKECSIITLEEVFNGEKHW